MFVCQHSLKKKKKKLTTYAHCFSVDYEKSILLPLVEIFFLKPLLSLGFLCRCSARISLVPWNYRILTMLTPMNITSLRTRGNRNGRKESKFQPVQKQFHSLLSGNSDCTSSMCAECELREGGPSKKRWSKHSPRFLVVTVTPPMQQPPGMLLSQTSTNLENISVALEIWFCLDTMMVSTLQV